MNQFIDMVASASVVTLETALLTGIGALSGVVTYLWKFVKEQIQELREDRDECIEDRDVLWKALISQNPNAAELRKTKD
jgi:hypothetical protein